MTLLPRFLPLLLAATAPLLLAQGPSGSDLKLQGPALRAFLKTRGRALLGRDVHWHVPAQRLTKAVARRRGQQLFVVNRIGILMPLRSRALDELRRRGGTACLRGRVVRLTRPKPKANGKSKAPRKKAAVKVRKPALPEFAILVRELSRRRG